MATTAIKICGITTAEALDATIAARADYAGLVFHPASPRYLSIAQAAALGGQAQDRTLKVGLFVDASDDMVQDAFGAARLDALQLQGSETPQRVAQLKQRFGVPVWKAIAVASAEDIDRAADYAAEADLVLFDAKTPKGALPGGLGLSFDWSLLRRWKAPCAWGLAGGLDPENVAEAIRLTGAPLVDVSSGVQRSPEIKDPAKIAAFCAAVRRA